MARPLSVAEKILPLIAVTIKLVDGANVVDKTVPSHREAADGLKVLGDDLKSLQKEMLQINVNLSGLVNKTKDGTFKKLLRDKNGQMAVKDLHGALEETFECLKRLAGAEEDGRRQLTEHPHDDRSLVFILASLQQNLTPSKVDNAVSSLRSMQLDIKACKEKVDGAFARTVKLYNPTNNQKPSTSNSNPSYASAIMTIRDKLVRLLKPQKSKRTGAKNEGGSSNAELASANGPDIRPSPEVQLLQLPSELLIIIITILNDDFLQDYPRGTDTLPDLRLTCKTLAILGAPLLFRTVSLKEVDSERQRRLEENVQGLGEFVQKLDLVLVNGVTDDKASRVYRMLAHMPNVRFLTVIHGREDVAGHTTLLTTIDRFSRLESITLQETSYNASFNHLPHRSVEVPQTFFHRFLQKTVELHGCRLKAVYLYTLLPLTEDLYVKIRDFTPNLQHITLTGNIGVELRDRFAEPVLWASGKTGSLESFTLHNCAGAHAGNFVRNVLHGVYGTQLKSVQMVACGYSQTDVPFIPDTSTPTQTTVDHLHLDHMSEWELEALSRIPVRDLSLTRLQPEDILQLPALLVHGFAGMRKMRLNPSMASFKAWEKVSKATEAAFKEVQERCSHQGIQLSFDAVTWPDACSSHIHI